MNPFLLFFRAYWWQILCATACLIIIAYVSLLKHENNALKRDNASLQATIASISALGKAQSDKADRIEQGGQQAAKIITDQYTSDLQKVKDYYAKNPIVKYKPVSVCNNTSSNSAEQVPTTPTSTERTDEATAHTVFDRPSLAEDCAVTTLMLLKLQEFETTQQAIQ